MADITMDLIKQLRDKTQVGMMDCKKALIEANGDFDKAVEILRKKGASVAAKRSDQATNNGTITTFIAPNYKVGALAEIACETDFSANTTAMEEFSNAVAEHVAVSPECCEKTCDVDCLLKQRLVNDDTMTIQALLDELIAKISENIKISQTARFQAGENGFVNSYIHPGANLGVMIELDVPGLTDDKKPVVAELAKDLCMQIAVTNPLSIDPSSLDQTVVEKERSFQEEQLKQSGKPADIIAKIMDGKMNKFYEDACLTHQKYIKNDKVSVKAHIDEVAKQIGFPISITRFKRFAIGK